MPAGKYNTIIEQGSVFRRNLGWLNDANEDMDLSLYPTARMQIRFRKETSSPLIWQLTTENGGITISEENGIDLYIPASVTELFDFGQAFYDLELIPIDSDETIRLIEGVVSLSRGSTTEDES